MNTPVSISAAGAFPAIGWRRISALAAGFLALVTPWSLAGTWESLNPGAGGQIQDLVLDPNTPGRLFYMSDVEGSYRSDDYGQSWTYVTTDTANSHHLTATVEPGNAQRVYLGRDDGLSISDDAGLSWTNVPPASVPGPVMEVVVNPQNPNEVYAINSRRWRWNESPTNRNGVRAVHLSRDRGATWRSVTYEPQNGLRDTYALALHPTNPAELWLAGIAGLYLSSDRGETWTRQASPAGWDASCRGVVLSPDGQVLYAAFAAASGEARLFARRLAGGEWIDLFAVAPTPPRTGAYWIPRIDPRSTATRHTLLTAAPNNAPAGLHEVVVEWTGSSAVTVSIRSILTWDTGVYGGDHSTPYTKDVGWELYWTRPLTWRFTPLSWGESGRGIWSSKDQTPFFAATDSPDFPRNWEQRYTRLVSAEGNVRTYRTTGTASTVDFDGSAFGNHALAANADNGLMESWDHGYSWSIDVRPNGNNGSRSNAVAYATVDKVTWALGHVASGFGAASDTGTLFAKQLSRPASKTDAWKAVAGGTTMRAGLPNQKYNPIVPDPAVPGRVYVGVVRNAAGAPGTVYVTDDIAAVVAGTGSFRRVGEGGPAINSDQDQGLWVDPHRPEHLYAGGSGSTLWRATRAADGSYTWQQVRTGLSNPVVWSRDGQTWIAGIAGGNTVEVSRDQGATWTRVLQFADVASLRQPGWYTGQNLSVRWLVANGDSLFCTYVTGSGQKRGFGVFRGVLDANGTSARWTDYTADLPFPYPMKARIVHNRGRDWLYLATWGMGLWRRPILPEASENGRAAELRNVSIRAAIEADGRAIAGFSVGGAGEKRVLVRVVGPTLAAFGVTQPAANPVAELYAGQQRIRRNDDWSQQERSEDVAVVSGETARLGAFGLPAQSADSALVASLAPGVYTVHASDAARTGGVMLIEVYDLDAPGSASWLANVSARTLLQPNGEPLIGGFILHGERPRELLIRGVGPALAAHGVSSVAPNPELELFAGSESLGGNRGWCCSFDPVAVSAAASAVSAFPLPPQSADSALLESLWAGGFTVHLRPGATAGSALMEVYEVR